MLENTEYVDIRVGSGAIILFRRIEIPIYNAFCEFIDNSLQSYLDHEAELKAIGQTACNVEISWTNDQIVITDNAYGMNSEAFGRAMRWNAPATTYSPGSLSRYGMGLKYAAVNLGGVWQIQTTELGGSDEFNGTVDTEYLASNPEKLPIIRKQVSTNDHYTIIKIKKLLIKSTERALQEVLKKLGITYQYYLSTSKNLSISINGIKVSYVEPHFWQDENGSEYYEVISDGKFIFNGKTYEYTGAVGILNKGSNKEAGLNLMQNHRGITLLYKPDVIFGTGNTFMSQRIVGTIDFKGNNWVTRVSKDGLLWSSDGLQERFLADLKSKENIKKLLKIAATLRKRENKKIKIIPKTEGANISGLKPKYDIDDKVTFQVSPYDGYSLKEVKWGSTVLIPDTSNSNNYSFVISPDCPQEIKITVKAIQDSPSAIPVKTPVSANIPSDSQNNVPVATPKIPRAQEIKNILDEVFKPLQSHSLLLKDEKKGEIYKDGVEINFKNISFGIEVQEINDPDADEWMEFIEKPGFVRSYELVVNYAAGIFKRIGINEESKKLMLIMATLLSLSRIASVPSGLKKEDANILFSTLNKIIVEAGK